MVLKLLENERLRSHTALQQLPKPTIDLGVMASASPEEVMGQAHMKLALSLAHVTELAIPGVHEAIDDELRGLHTR